MRYRIHPMMPSRDLGPMVVDSRHTVAELYVEEGRGQLMVLVPSFEDSLQQIFTNRLWDDDFLNRQAVSELGRLGLTLVSA